MDRRGSLIAILVAAAWSAPVDAGTGATFSLGLTGEYFVEEQISEGVTAEDSSLQSVLSLGTTGHLFDPRFLLFDLGVDYGITDRKQTSFDDTSTKQLSYNAVISALTNRPVSFTVGIARQDTDVTGSAPGSVTDGVSDWAFGSISLRAKRWPNITLRHRREEFTPDSEGTLREESREVTGLLGDYRVGRSKFSLDLSSEQAEIFGRRFQQDLDLGVLNYDFNRGGTNSWHTYLYANRYASLNLDSGLSSSSTTALAQNGFRHMTAAGGFWEAAADYQQTDFEDDTVDSSRVALRGIHPIRDNLDLEGEISYLRTEDSQRRLDQPTAGAGIRWTRGSGHWRYALHPFATYVQTSPSDGDSESSIGGRLYASAEYSRGRGSLRTELDVSKNQLSISPTGPGGDVGGSSFLAGLDKEHERARIRATYQVADRSTLFGEAQYRRRVRVDRGAEVTEELVYGQVEVAVASFRLLAGADLVEVTGGGLPSRTEIIRVDLKWAPWRSFAIDGRLRQEDREAIGLAGRFELIELGLRYNYAKLMFFVRAREEITEDEVFDQRTNRRYWIGLRRVFDLSVGDLR